MSIHSFAILAYKESPFLEVCVRSVMEQTTETNVIMTTSTPTEFSRKIAEKYAIKYIINTTGQYGLIADFNFAYSSAETELVTLVHQDDLYLPDYANAILNAYQKANNPQILFTDCFELNNDVIKTHSLKLFIKKILLCPFLFSNQIGSNFWKKAILSFGSPICCPTVTFNKTQLQGFSFSYDYSCASDWNAWYIMANQKGSFVYINKKLIQYRVHAGSETSNLLTKRNLDDLNMLTLIWGNKIGKMIAEVYKFSSYDR